MPRREVGVPYNRLFYKPIYKYVTRLAVSFKRF
jgi:hypothetical protein